MKAHEIFGIVVRAIGIWKIATGIPLLPSFFGQAGRYSGSIDLLKNVSWTALSLAGLDIVVGALLICFAKPIVALAYRNGDNKGTGGNIEN